MARCWPRLPVEELAKEVVVEPACEKPQQLKGKNNVKNWSNELHDKEKTDIGKELNRKRNDMDDVKKEADGQGEGGEGGGDTRVGIEVRVGVGVGIGAGGNDDKSGSRSSPSSPTTETDPPDPQQTWPLRRPGNINLI